MECTSTCWFLESCIHKWNNPVPQQLPERAWLCRNPTRQSKCQSSPHNTSCGKKTTFFFFTAEALLFTRLPSCLNISFQFKLKHWRSSSEFLFVTRASKSVFTLWDQAAASCRSFWDEPIPCRAEISHWGSPLLRTWRWTCTKKSQQGNNAKKRKSSAQKNKQTNLTYKTRYTKQTFTWEFKSKDVKPK